MKVLIGAYSQLSLAQPVPVFERALLSVLKPLLTYVYNKPETVLQLSLSFPLMEWLDINHPEVNMLITDLARKNQVELMTGSYNQSILSLLSPKDRSNQIEMTTTWIRKKYGQRPKTLFSYGQFFNPVYINTLNLCCIDTLVISSFNESLKKEEATEPFLMQELGKSLYIYPTDTPIAYAVQQYGRRVIGFGNLLTQVKNAMEMGDEYVFPMINLDQLLQGNINEEQVVALFEALYSKPASALDEIHDPDQRFKKGYLQPGWYGFDAIRDDLCSINDLFVQDESLNYLYGRYTSLAEHARMYKKDKDVRKRIESLLLKVSTGTPYLCDASASMLRSSVRKLFWRYISEADCVLSGLSDYNYPSSVDYDNDEFDEFRVMGKYISSVIDTKGGALSELTYLPSLFNYGDTLSPLECFGKANVLHPVERGTKQRLFSDVLMASKYVLDEYSKLDANNVINLGGQTYDLVPLDRRNTEFQASVSVQPVSWLGGELELSKHYKFRQNTVLLEITLNNTSDENLAFRYGCELPLSVAYKKEPVSFLVLENKKTSQYDEKEVILPNVKSLRVYDEPNSTALTLVADTRFTLLKEDYTIDITTTLGEESLYQHTLFMASWPMVLEAGSEQKITLGLRVERK